jgi:hypothetical protein
VSGPTRQSGRLDLEDILYLGFKGLFRPCRGFNRLELLYEIFLDGNSIQAVIKGYSPR